MRRLLLLVGLLTAAGPTAAQVRPTVGLSVSQVGADGEASSLFLAGSVGGTARVGAVLFSAQAEAGSASRSTSGDPYGYDPGSFGTSDDSAYLCRDYRTGAVVPSGLCEASAVQAAVSAGASLLVPGVRDLSLGAGYRLGFGETPYATLGYPVRLGEGGRAGIRFEAELSQSVNGLRATFLL